MAWIVALSALALILAAGAFLLWAVGGRGREDAVLDCPVEQVGDPAGAPVEVPSPPQDGRLRVMSYNVAYCRGPYDDRGDLRSRETIEGFVRRVAEVIRKANPDIVALQEVDFDSHRTHGIDQAAEIARLAGLPFVARVSTWDANYVAWPYWPPWQHYGRMHSGQCLLARYPIRKNVRHRLPQPGANPWWYNLFYLHRAVQVADVAVGSRTVRVFNTHLEAFDRANREEQARLLAALYLRANTGADIILGDMNAVPAEASIKNEFPDEPRYDGTGESTIDTLRAIEGISEIIPPKRYLADEPAALTFPAYAPTRRLDYLFFSEAFTRVSGEVDRRAGTASDHLPIVGEFILTANEPAI